MNLPADPGAGAIALEPHAKRADRACIVVGHGGGNDRVYGLWPLLPALLDRGFAVVLAHLPGHGRGGEDLYSTDRGRARMDALVELALGPLGAGCVLLLGQSMGAAFALDATLRGSRARAVVAISAPIELAPLSAALRDVLAFAHPAVYRALRYGTPLELMPAVGPFRREQFPVRLEPGVHYLDAFAATVRELDLERRLQSVSPPALPPLFFVHGAADAIAPSPPAVRTAAALGPAARTLVVPAVRHLDILFRPEVVGAVADWLVEQADRRV